MSSATATRPEAPSSKAAQAQAQAAPLTPHLVCRDAAAALDFYQRAFGAEELYVIRCPEGGIMHAALAVNGAPVYLANECPEFGSRGPQALGGSPVTLHLQVADCDAVFARAVAAGCAARMPPQEMFWGDRYGVLEDPYGHRWSVATTVRRLTPEEMQRGAAACAAGMKQEMERRKVAGAAGH